MKYWFPNTHVKKNKGIEGSKDYGKQKGFSFYNVGIIDSDDFPYLVQFIKQMRMQHLMPND